ncbi:MAG: hypothetical protein ACM3KE_15255, partial [Hyphomicrobiales bacterium]
KKTALSPPGELRDDPVGAEKMTARMSDSRKQNLAAAAGLAQSSFACPLCGQARPFSKEAFESANVNAQAVIFSAPTGSSRSSPGGDRAVFLNQLGSREDLAWIKRRIILRCTDIIRVLSN